MWIHLSDERPPQKGKLDKTVYKGKNLAKSHFFVFTFFGSILSRRYIFMLDFLNTFYDFYISKGKN